MIRINDLKCKATLKAAAVVSVFLLFCAVAGFGQQQINLTAAPTTTTLPDGTTVPMWGYFCGTAVSGSTATCAALNPASSTSTGTTWSPVVITVPTGAAGGLQINLSNSLSFTPTGTTTANTIPTSIVIVGQVGGGLGLPPTTTSAPDHSNAQGCVSWFIANNLPSTPCTSVTNQGLATPPAQGPRVRSMGTELAATAACVPVAPATTCINPSTALLWSALKPGTYLIESGTHPSIQVPMGLIGVLVVTNTPGSGATGTTATTGVAYPANSVTGALAVPYNAEVPLEFSEIDPVQNTEVNLAVNTAGFSETAVWSAMNTPATTTSSGAAVAAVVGCGVTHTCYPPAVNYTPLYYLINGVALNKTLPANSVFPATAGTAGVVNGTCTLPTSTSTCPVTTGITGTVLVRVVNAGLRMHTPSIVGSTSPGFNGAGAAATVAGFALIAEDGNVLPNVAPAGATTVPAAPRVQTDVLMVPSKVYDLLVNVPAASTTCTPVAPATTCTPALPIYARDLALSGNASERDAGAVAYISVNNPLGSSAGLPVAAGSGIFATAVARPDTYNSIVAGKPFTVTDVSKGLLANDTNVYGATLVTGTGFGPTNGTLSCPASSAVMGLAAATVGVTDGGICANGTFTWTPTGTATTDSFTYCANGTVTAGVCSSKMTATVTLGASTLAGNPTAINLTWTAKSSTFIKIPSPGLLEFNSDPNGLPISIAVPTTLPAGVVALDATGGFSVLQSAPSTTAITTVSFPYTVQNSQGRSASGTVTINFPIPSNLKVNVVDAQAYKNCNGSSSCISGLTPFADYRWIIEEDKTFYNDPNCTTNASITTAGCPVPVAAGGTIPTFGVQFHTSNMDYVAQGCTGPLSCEGGQTMLDPATGTHVAAVCDLGNGACRPDTTGNGFTQVLPSTVALDPSKRYYISILPGDAANPFPSNTNPAACKGVEAAAGNTACGHTMGGAPIPAACNVLLNATTPCSSTTGQAFATVTVPVLPTPLPTGRLSVIVFEDDFPLNGEQDGGGGNGTVAPIEPGLGGFNLVLWDTFGGLGDVTGQDTYDAFNQPLSNGLAGTIDPTSGLDACPVSATPLTGSPGSGTPAGSTDAPVAGMTGMIVTCPKYESDGTTLSPLAGQAVIYNLMPDKFSVQAYPGADRIARGEQWLQTNTLDGQHPHDSFIRIGEPGYFQEYGPAGFHVAIGFANPAIINARHNDVCQGFGTPGTVGPCTNTITGQVDVQRISRTPDQRLYPSGSRDAFAWTQCWISLGDPDGEDFQFTFCDAKGNFVFNNVPGGNWRLTIGDQWNDQIIDGLSTPANVGCTSALPNGTNNATTCPGGQTLNMGNIGVQQWQANVYTRTFVDDNKNGIWDQGEIGIPFLYTRVYYRDGSNANGLNTDFNGVANFNETFPLFNWYVVEADSTRYKTTGIHSVYDAGGPADGSPSCGDGVSARLCGSKSTTSPYAFFTNTYESVPLPTDLHVPGAVYCAAADCSAEATAYSKGTANTSTVTNSTGRIDPPWVTSEGWSGLTGLSNWIDFGKAPYAACNPSLPVSATNFCATVTTTAPGSTTSATSLVGENGGIHGQVSYASTRPFDNADQMILQPWEPLVPGVTINLYQEGFAADGVTPTLKMVDTTVTSSWDAWAQGFWPGSTVSSAGGGGLLSYMNCPGQGTNVTGTPNYDLFYFTLFDQPNFLDYYASLHGGAAVHPLPYNSQYKCYDSMHIGNQIQPAPYNGEYYFPSSLGINPTNGKLLTTTTPTGTTPLYGSTNGVASNMAGTNCTVCVPNPDTTDVYRVGSPMLPPGKYVVEVIMPSGYEVYKEEDKNLLIGDNFIAPVTQQFGGLGGDIFIVPDQASVASMYDESAAGYNPSNYQDATTGLATTDNLSGVPGYPGFQDPVWPCVGEQRIVPDYLSLFPGAKEVAPFAGATRPLCDRKEVALGNQMNVRMHFAIFTSTHIASKFTGGITDDFTSEFDPFAPQFGEKFAPPNMPISTKDYLGNEISRVYSDHWGTYNGLTFSSWEVNPPNITGYSPSMMVQCMNDPGPILDTRSTIPNPLAGTPGQPATIPNQTYGQMITDPLYNPAYSNFCYEDPFMPGLTDYLDTPVVPTQAFVGAGYNNPDCSYPDATPAVAEVDGDGIGPWVSKSGVTLAIKALGDQVVQNSTYSGPSANTAPFNLKTITHHYGFGTQCLSPTAGSTTCSTLSSVTIGGRPAVIDSWTDAAIQVTVPTGVPNCAVQQQAQYGGSAAQCGELLITAGNGKQSIDSVTVTIGGKTPTHVSANQTVQSAIDAAAPGDLIIVDPTCMTTGASPASVACSMAALDAATPSQTATAGSHNEMLIMWKPVRLQGVGAATSIINASAFPAGTLLDPWRRHINCLFGLTLSGVPYTASTGTAPYDPTGNYSCPDTGWQYFTAQPNAPQIDRLPLEAVLGWDATLNGNLAEQLQEPSLMGAFEGAGITVLGKGVDYHGVNPWTDGNEGGAFPTVTTLLTGVGPVPTALPVGDANPLCVDGSSGANRFPSDFTCNPSSIDGLSINNSSQGGGGIFAHGWAHHLQIANNRIYNNAGTLTGGISVGQGEFPTPLVAGGAATNAAPGSCSDGTGLVANQHLPYCLQLQVNVHNNFITNNSSLGDELFSGTLSGGGGVTFCTGNDYYKFNYNWVCGNLSSAEGGGLVHLGEIQNGDIEHNTIAINQSDNPTIPTNGGGIHIQGTPDTDPVCGTSIDADCPPGLSDGIGHNLIINANLIQGNMAQSGSGGGIRLQQVNGTEVSFFPTQPSLWNNVSITNNMIVNNVAGWDGGGISLQDALAVSIVNNTIASNDSLASSGVLTQSIGTPDSSAPAGSCVQAGLTTSCPQSAGVTSTPNSSILTTTFTGLTLTCPTGTTGCMGFSNPLLENNVIWQNRSFYIGITGSGLGTVSQQNLVALFSANGTAAPAQTASGQCSTGVSYWDIGVRGDAWATGAPNHASGFTLNPTYSVLDDAGYASTNVSSNPSIVSQYCNGSRVPPECTSAQGCAGPNGYGVPPGIVDASTPNPRFSLTPAATVDEGNNWINVSWGPLSVSNDALPGGLNGNYGGGPLFANYALAAGSPAIDYVPLSSTTLPTATNPALSLDFFGNPRPDPANPNHFDVGAVEFQGGSGVGTLSSISPNSGQQGTVVNVTITGTNLTLASAVNVSGGGITVSNFVAASATTVTATFTISPTAALGARNVTVTTPAGTSSAVTFTVVAPAAPTLTSINPAFGLRGTAVNVTLTGTNFVTGSTVVATPAVPGFSIGSVTVVNATTITATFSSNTSAPLGNVNIDVVDGGGASNTVPFAITGPALTVIAPNSGNQGNGATANVVNVTLTGSGLTGTTAVSISGTGITVSNVLVVSDSQVTATFAIASNATGGARNVTTTGAAGTSNAVTFTVLVPPGALSSISPTTGAQGTSVLVTLTGQSLTGSTALAVSGGGITVSGFTVVNDTTITATFTIAPTAALTARNVTVTTPGGVSNPETFTVVSPGTPTLASIAPNSGLRGAAVPVTLTGTGFTATGTTVNVAAPANGLTISGVTVVNATTITATFTTTATGPFAATIGPRSIFVTTPGGSTGTVVYTVTGPVLTSIVPASGNRGTTVPVSIFGSGLTGTTAVTVSGGGGGFGGVTVSGVTVVNDSQVNATFTIGRFAAATARNVTVTAPGGASNAVTFTVTIPPAPTLTTIAPPTGVRGTTVPVTLTGTNFVMGATTVAVSGGGGGGIGVSGVTVTSPTTLNATFNIPTGATLGAHNVTVTTPGGASNTVPFTVQGATITSIVPNTATHPATGTLAVPVTITGANLTGATGLTGLGGGGGGTGVTATGFTVVNSTTITVTLNIPSGVTTGIRNIGVNTPIGATNTLPFTIN